MGKMFNFLRSKHPNPSEKKALVFFKSLDQQSGLSVVTKTFSEMQMEPEKNMARAFSVAHSDDLHHFGMEFIDAVGRHHKIVMKPQDFMAMIESFPAMFESWEMYAKECFK